MARDSFKKRFLKNLNSATIAAIYSFASSLALALLMLFWQPISTPLWSFKDGIGFWVATLLFLAGWLFAFFATFMINHFALFGLTQGYRVLKNIPEPKPIFQVRYFYKYIRHPIQAGTIVGLFAAPSMSYGHLLFALSMTLYILIGLYFEERSLVTEFKDQYKEYQKNVPMLVPFLSPK